MSFSVQFLRPFPAKRVEGSLKTIPSLSFRPREGATRLTEWRNLARKRIWRQTLLPCSDLLYHSRQDPSTDARDDKDSFCFQRSFGARALCPRLLRMTGEIYFARSGCQGEPFLTPSSILHSTFYILHFRRDLAFPLGGRWHEPLAANDGRGVLAAVRHVVHAARASRMRRAGGGAKRHAYCSFRATG